MKKTAVTILIWIISLAVAHQLRAQGGILRRDDPQAGIIKGQTIDKEDEACLAKAEDMVAIQACDKAEMQRQQSRMETAFRTLLSKPGVDRQAVESSQESWKQYYAATCKLVAYWYRWPADMGKHEKTCEWRMVRLRADELQLLLKSAGEALR